MHIALHSLHIVIFGAIGALIYFIGSDESPLKKKLYSTFSGLFMAILFSDFIADNLNVSNLDWAIAGILGWSGRWTVDLAIAVRGKLAKSKVGE